MTALSKWAGSPAVVRILPFAIYMLFLVVESFFADRSTSWDQRWLYAVKISLVAVVLLVLLKRYTELLKPAAASANEWLIGVVTGVVVFVIWINLDQSWASMGEGKGFAPHRPGTQELDLVLVIFRVTGAALIVPIMEELFWRSFLLRWVERQDFQSVLPREIGRNAILITAVLFALEHNLWLAGFIAGLMYNLLYRRTGNLWIVILAHAITNGMLAGWVLYTGQWHFW